MSPAQLEHVNITVRDAQRTVAELKAFFRWKTRWHGPAAKGGYTYHVGSDKSYVAVYQSQAGQDMPDHKKGLPLNHIAVVVDDLYQVEHAIKAGGYETFSHGNYEPGRRFYFFNSDGIEFEVVSYR